MAFKLIHPSSVCASILSLQICVDDANWLMLRGIPKLRQSELKMIQKQLEVEPVPDVLVKHGFAFPFSPSELESVLKDGRQNPELTVYYVLMSFLAWYVLFSKSNWHDHVELVLNSLLSLLSDPTFLQNQRTNVEVIVTSAFANVVSEILSKRLETIELLKPLGTYLVNARTLHPEVLDLIVQMGQRVIGVSSTVSGSAQDFCDAFIRMIEKRRQPSLKGFIAKMLHVYDNSVVHLDPYALQVFQYAASSLEQREICLLMEPMLTELLTLVTEKRIPDFVASDGNPGVVELNFDRKGGKVELPLDLYML